MKRARVCTGLVALLFLLAVRLTWAAPGDLQKLPGRQVKVAAVVIGFGGDHDAKLKLENGQVGVCGAAPNAVPQKTLESRA